MDAQTDIRARQLLEEKKSVFLATRSPSLSLSAFLDEFMGPTRFKSPLRLFEKAEIALVRRLSDSNLFSNVRVISPYSTPAYWQILLNYFWREGILETPEFHFIRWANDLPKNYSVELSPVFDLAKTSGREVRYSAFGNATVIEEAYGKAMGELLERYMLTLYKDDKLLLGSYDELHRQNKNPLNIKHLSTFSDWQKIKNNRLGVSDESVLAWVPGTELVSGEKALIPAQRVFWSYRFGSNEPILTNPTTSGGAGHFTFEEAVLSAVYENVQRDSFFLYWLNTLSPPVMDIATFPEKSVAHTIKAECERYGLSVYFLDTTSDVLIPSCVCALVDQRSEDPRVSIGASSGFDTEKNLSSSFSEALSISNYLLDLEEFELPSDYLPFSNDPPIEKTERIRFWKGLQAIDRFSFFISGEKISADKSFFYQYARSFKAVAEEYDYMRNIFRQKGEGYELYCYTVTHPVLTRIGYTVVKVVVPTLFPLYLREHMATLDSLRLRETASRFGAKEPKLNPWPHPFS